VTSDRTPSRRYRNTRPKIADSALPRDELAPPRHPRSRLFQGSTRAGDPAVASTRKGASGELVAGASGGLVVALSLTAGPPASGTRSAHAQAANVPAEVHVCLPTAGGHAHSTLCRDTRGDALRVGAGTHLVL